MTIDPQIQTALVSLAATAIAVLGGWALSILERKLGIDKNDRAAQTFENAISNGIAIGAKVVATKIAAGINVGDPTAAVVSEALSYAGPKVQPEMKQLGMTEASLPERVQARVATVMLPTPAGMNPTEVTARLNAAQLKAPTP